jgi:hypothetical protein
VPVATVAASWQSVSLPTALQHGPELGQLRVDPAFARVAPHVLGRRAHDRVRPCQHLNVMATRQPVGIKRSRFDGRIFAQRPLNPARFTARVASSGAHGGEPTCVCNTYGDKSAQYGEHARLLSTNTCSPPPKIDGPSMPPCMCTVARSLFALVIGDGGPPIYETTR